MGDWSAFCVEESMTLGRAVTIPASTTDTELPAWIWSTTTIRCISMLSSYLKKFGTSLLIYWDEISSRMQTNVKIMSPCMCFFLSKFIKFRAKNNKNTEYCDWSGLGHERTQHKLLNGIDCRVCLFFYHFLMIWTQFFTCNIPMHACYSY